MSPPTQLFLAVSFGAAFAIVLWGRSRRTRRQRPIAAASSFGWVLLFLSSGRMPPPPPASQIEQEAGERKNREISHVDP